MNKKADVPLEGTSAHQRYHSPFCWLRRRQNVVPGRNAQSQGRRRRRASHSPNLPSVQFFQRPIYQTDDVFFPLRKSRSQPPSTSRAVPVSMIRATVQYVMFVFDGGSSLGPCAHYAKVESVWVGFDVLPCRASSKGKMGCRRAHGEKSREANGQEKIESIPWIEEFTNFLVRVISRITRISCISHPSCKAQH